MFTEGQKVRILYHDGALHNKVVAAVRPVQGKPALWEVLDDKGVTWVVEKRRMEMMPPDEDKPEILEEALRVIHEMCGVERVDPINWAALVLRSEEVDCRAAPLRIDGDYLLVGYGAHLVITELEYLDESYIRAAVEAWALTCEMLALNFDGDEEFPEDDNDCFECFGCGEDECVCPDDDYEAGEG